MWNSGRRLHQIGYIEEESRVITDPSMCLYYHVLIMKRHHQTITLSIPPEAQWDNESWLSSEGARSHAGRSDSPNARQRVRVRLAQVFSGLTQCRGNGSQRPLRLTARYGKHRRISWRPLPRLLYVVERRETFHHRGSYLRSLTSRS